MSSFPVILSSPSGGGKTTIAQELLKRRTDLGYSISCTTRSPRAGEIDGTDYFFLTPEEFEAARERGEFAECADVHGHFYGTLKREVDLALGSGRHVVMDIDIQGAQQFVEGYPDSVLIFILPPDGQVLLRRLEARGTEDPQSMARRLKSAIKELRSVGLYHYVVVNADLDKAVTAVSEIIDAEGAKRARVNGLDQRIEGIVHDLERQLEHIQRSQS